MAKAGQRKCMSCGEFFAPDHRSGERQRYCCAADCRRASKAASQATWLARPPNNDYFSGPVHVARVQAWRAAHPGYSRGRTRPSRALQGKHSVSTSPGQARRTAAKLRLSGYSQMSLVGSTCW